MTPNLPYRFVERLKELPFVETIYLYGSRAREDNGPRSDIDIALECPQAGARDWQLVLDIVEEADTLLPIDVIRLDGLGDSKLKENINKDKVTLYRKGDCNGER